MKKTIDTFGHVLETSFEYKIQSRIDKVDPPEGWLLSAFDKLSYPSPGDAYNAIVTKGEHYARILNSDVSFRIIAIKTQTTVMNTYCFEYELHGQN